MSEAAARSAANRTSLLCENDLAVVASKVLRTSCPDPPRATRPQPCAGSTWCRRGRCPPADLWCCGAQLSFSGDVTARAAASQTKRKGADAGPTVLLARAHARALFLCSLHVRGGVDGHAPTSAGPRPQGADAHADCAHGNTRVHRWRGRMREHVRTRARAHAVPFLFGAWQALSRCPLDWALKKQVRITSSGPSFFFPPSCPPLHPYARARSLSLYSAHHPVLGSHCRSQRSQNARGTHTPSLRSDSLLSPMPPAILFNFGTAPLDWVVEFRNKRTLPAHHHPTTLGPLLHVRDHVPMQSTARPLSHSRVRLRVHDSARRCRALRAACACMHWLHACKQHALVACMQWWHGSRCWLKTLPRVDLCITRSPSPAPFRFSFAVISRCVLGCTPCRASPAALPRPRLPCRA